MRLHHIVEAQEFNRGMLEEMFRYRRPNGKRGRSEACAAPGRQDHGEPVLRREYPHALFL